ncbi:MAG: RNA polymerase sigma factor [Spirosomataceae bacterium]
MIQQKASIKDTNTRLIFLWNEAKEGNRQAFNALCEHHYRMLFNYAFTLTKDRELIKDILQDLLLNLWEKRNTLGDIHAMSIYLIKALRNNLLYHNRKNKFNYVDNFFDSEEDYLSDFSTVEGDIINYEIYSQNEVRVRKALELLPKRQREVLFLKFYQGKTYSEIADIMAINPQSVGNHIQKAFSTLRTLLPSDWQFAFLICLWSQ